MPRPKGGHLKGDQLKAARQGKLEKQAIVESDTALDNLQSSFRESKAYTTQLKQQLADQVQISTDLQNSLDASHDLINTLRAEILSLKSKNSGIYHQLRMERQRYKRATSKHGSMASQILLLQKHQPQICCPNNSRGIFCSSDSTWTRDENGRNHDF
jgi:hypothetical protein